MQTTTLGTDSSSTGHGGASGRWRGLVSTVASGAALAGWLAAGGGSQAATPLFDFETEGDLAAMRWGSKGESRLERSSHYASHGKWSLAFTSANWKKGQPEWPAFETRPPVTNWTGFDRLVVDLTNPREERFHFSLFVSDSKVPFRKGLSYTFNLPSRGFRRFEVPLSSFPKGVNRADISILHFFTERPAADLSLFLDNLVLLRPGETLPEPGGEMVRQLGALAMDGVAAAGASLARNRDQAQAPGVSAELKESARSQLSRFEQTITRLRSEVAAPGLTLTRLGEINAELAALPGKVDRTLSVIRFQKACAEAGLPTKNLLLGTATSMEKVLPRDMPFEIKPARDITLSLARNEKESFQLLALPVAEPLRRVEVKAEDLKGPGGAVFPRGSIQCEVVGYVETKARPPYGTAQIGWWPDPILNFLGPVDIAAGDLQAFWIRLRAPKDQAAGEYRGRLSVVVEGQPQAGVDLRVRVRGFALPDHSPLPLAVTFGPHDFPTDATQKEQEGWRTEGDYPINAWKKHKLRWADFLADYYLNYDSLYRHGPPDFEIIKHLRDRGQLVAFNLGIFDAASRGEAAASNALTGLRTAYQQAKELEVLDHAYIYGFDECKPEMFPLLEKTAQTLRREFPGALLMTTSYDHSYGMDTVVKTIDAWCPLTPSFDPAKAARARAAGRKVWWYICCGPHHPHANMFVEYPAIEGRLLMGAMTARQRPDGFLYYQISIWNSRRPITKGPFTDWDPRSWTTYHGDGSWTCAGPDGTPLPTVRLENFRDGLEDYAYVILLEDLIRRREAAGTQLAAPEQRWLAEAKAAVVVPATVMKSMTDYSRDPAALYAWREQLGDLIDRAGVPVANPWGKRFGARGF